MYINKIKLQNFRNYSEQEIELNKNINIFYGNNAQGKTNILEAIFLSSFGKSFRTTKDKEMIKLNENFAKVNIDFQKKNIDGKINITISDKKTILVNGIKIKKLSELLGKINIVIFTPDDMEILKQGPAKRRKFLDMMISQVRPNYIHILNNYLKTLEQRNNYLKENYINDEMLDIWDEKLVEYGYQIYQYRNEFLEKIKSKIGEIHKEITDEEIKIKYITDCSEKNKFKEKLEKNLPLDRMKKYTSVGCHRDDFKVFINGKEVNIYGSQGQSRTAILSLKLSELQVISDEIGENPILLLDDFMSELDETRITNFLKKVGDIQVIITCTKKINIDNCKYFKVDNGNVEINN